MGFEAGFGVGCGADDAGEAFGIDVDIDGCGGAGVGVDGVGGGDGVEHGGGVAVGGAGPFGGEDLNGVGEGGAEGGEQVALGLIEADLRGVERHHVDVDAGVEELLRGGGVHGDVVFGVRRSGGDEAVVLVITAIDRAAHQDDSFQLAEGRGVAVDGGADVGEGADSDEGKFAGVLFDLVEQQGDRVGVLVIDAFAGPGPLGERAGTGASLRDSGGYGDFFASGLAEQAVDHAAAHRSVAPGGGDTHDLDVGAGEEEAEGEDVVDIVADVGIEEDLVGWRDVPRGLGAGCGCAEIYEQDYSD